MLTGLGTIRIIIWSASDLEYLLVNIDANLEKASMRHVWRSYRLAPPT